VAVEPGAVMAAFIPTEKECHQASKNDLTNEFIFIVDCSGSMQDENKIGLARQAMLLFLKSLPVNCHFNIVRFGSQYKTLFNEITAVYNETNAQQAEQLIKEMQADLGGTELVSFISFILILLFLVFIRSCDLFNGLSKICLVKVVHVKYFF
jgi:hypothetical protein